MAVEEKRTADEWDKKLGTSQKRLRSFVISASNLHQLNIKIEQESINIEKAGLKVLDIHWCGGNVLTGWVAQILYR